MNCISEETAMLYVEREMEDATQAEEHLEVCGACQELVASLRAENAALSSVLRHPAPDRRLRALAQLAGSIAASVTVAVPAQWAAARLGEAGMWMNHVAALPFELAFRAARALTPLTVLILLTQAVTPAMTRRSGQGAVVIGSQETITDTVIATGESVLVEGKIQGNLFVFGRTVEVRGEVDGDVIGGAQEVRITGKVTGNVIVGGESITISGHVSGNVYGGGRNVHVERGGTVERDVFSGSETVTVEGTIGRGLTSGASTAVIAGTVGRGIVFGGEKVLVRASGKVGGDIRATLPDRNNLQVDPGATVSGQTNVSVAQPRDTGTGVGSYVWEAAVLIGAFLMGGLLRALFPGFFGGAVGKVLSWPSAGVGFVALIVAPIAALLLCVTVIGIPAGIAVMFLYLTGLYLAKIVVAGYLGRELLRARDGLPTLPGLLAGLVLLQAVFWVPYGGGLIHFAVFCLGLGALTLQLMKSRSAGARAIG